MCNRENQASGKRLELSTDGSRQKLRVCLTRLDRFVSEEIERLDRSDVLLDDGRSCEPQTKIEQRRSIVSLQPLCSDHLYRIAIEIEFQRKSS
jgi:hypothetical protein